MRPMLAVPPVHAVPTKPTKPAVPAVPAAVLLAFLSACGAPQDEGSGNAPSAGAAQGEGGADGAGGSAGAVEAEIGAAHEYRDGLTVEVSNVSREVSAEWAVPKSTPYAKFTVQVHNGTEEPVDLMQFDVQCAVGEDGRGAESVFDTDAGVGDGFASTVLAGDSATMDWGCELSEDESYLQIEVSPNDDLRQRPTVFFTGDV